MNLEGVRDILEAEVLYGSEYLGNVVTMVSASDLLSDVLAFTRPGSLLLTGLINPQVIRTAEVVELSAICFVRGKRPTEATIELAKEKEVPLLCTKLPMYETSGKLYRCGIAGCSEVDGEDECLL
ncbi:DRTGG domain-containing protein [Candidatus Poribacteria bacterium]